MKYRSNIEVISKMLQVANSGHATKTEIMYQAFLGYHQMKKHLDLLTKRDLLHYDEDTQTFKTTDRGRSFLQIYKQMDGMIKISQKEQQHQQYP
jgi:predicted transcriptional regulator